MKKLILVFFVIGTVMVFFSCQEESALAPEIGQSNQMITTLAKKPAPSLQCTINYVLAGPPWTYDDEERRFVWDGNIHGDIEGQIIWWFVLGAGPPIPDAAHVGFYEARWEIYDEDPFLRDETGKLFFPIIPNPEAELLL